MTPDREKKRERERKARVRRASKLELMRSTVNGLQETVLAVHTLEDDAWGRFLNANAMRARQLLLLAKEARALVIEQAVLQRLLKEHQLMSSSITTMLAELPARDWERRVDRLRELSRKHYVPWTMDECHPLIDAALKEVDAFQWSTNKQSSGLSFLGWREVRHVDLVRGVFQFQFHKTFRGLDMMHYVNVGWDIYTNPETFQEIIIGPHLLGFHDVLQQLTPNLMIVRVAYRFQNVIGDLHNVYLVARVKTERGMTQFMRSITCPELKDVFQSPTDVWASNFIWFQWEQHEYQAYTFRLGGSLRGIDSSHMNQWMLEVFGCVIRSERLATGLQPLNNQLLPCSAAS